MNAARASRTDRPQHAKTSSDILRERDELDSRVIILEAVLRAIGEETRHALTHPQISLTTLCRIEALVRQAELEPRSEPAPVSVPAPVSEPAPVSGLRPLRRA